METASPTTKAQDTLSLDALARQAAKDKEALHVLLERIRPQLVSYITREGRIPEWDAEDLVQVALVRITRHIERFDPQRAQFRTWARKITLRLLFNDLRDQKRRVEVLQNFATDQALRIQDQSRRERPDHLFDERDLRAALEEAAKYVRPPFREVFELSLEGLSHEEIAQKTGLPSGTIKSQLSRGRAQARPHLRSYRT